MITLPKVREMKYLFLVFLFLITVLCGSSFSAESDVKVLKVAVAANFIEPFKVISADFEKRTNVKVEATYSSSGAFYVQILNGAPYDIFLSADEERPRLLYDNGFAEKPFLYATGFVVLWQRKSDDTTCQERKNWQKLVQSKEVKRIAIANPKIAPYGDASQQAIASAKLDVVLNDKFVFAQNIGEAFHYALTGSVDVAFCALSSALSSKGENGCYLLIKEAPPIKQYGCIIKKSNNQDVANQLVEFLSSKEVRLIKEGYGYR
ncbi:MAG: molybdate ABC transporter substrate-binding protein [Deltaproteobacteria bacterium]|nr:molybdate ABC transporter substrate-binding protein [Deltaproteobacteria bacterium]